MVRIAVVGSGPSAAAALSYALSIPELEIFHVDTSLESGRGTPLDSSEKKLITKTFVGGDYPYRRFPGAAPFIQSKTAIPRSFANGGLSLVWGATMLPFAKADCISWPIHWEELELHYQAVARIIPIAGYRNFNNLDYKDYGVVEQLNPSRRFRMILSQKDLSKKPWVVAARVAIKTKSTTDEGCVLCNGCLNGCQWNYIWNSATFIRTIRANNLIKKESYLESITRTNGKVTLNLMGYHGEKSVLENLDKVFLACGVVETFRILAESKFIKSSTSLSDSAIAYIPFFSPFPGRNKSSGAYSLTQLALRISHSLEARPAHLQLYEIGQEVEGEISNRFPILKVLPVRLRRFLLNFFVIGIFYLPSELSPSIALTVLPEGSIVSRLDETKVTAKEQRGFVKKIFLENFPDFLRIGLLPLTFLQEQKSAGSGVHTGSFIPMGKETDTQGRLGDLKEVHIIDASVLPDIPAGPITYTVMANASRIISESLR
jgi:choline dehydrogenase-like flavoprotein